MKDNWKKLLCALAILPCVSIASACNFNNSNNQGGENTSTGDSGNSNTGTGEGTGESQLTPQEQLAQEKATAYTTLSNHAKALNNSATANFEMVTQSTSTTKESFDWEKFKTVNASKLTEMGLTTPEQINSFIEEFKSDNDLESDEEVEKYQSKIGYNGATSEGYLENRIYSEDLEGEGEYKLVNSNYTKKVGNDLIKYSNEGLKRAYYT